MSGSIKNIYDRIAGSADYQRNANALRAIQICVFTVSAIATGFVNSFAHVERLTWWGAVPLALLITGFVESFYFVLRHGLTTTYKAGKQRFFASLCYRGIQATMVLNAMILTAWIVGQEIPNWLVAWNHWSIAAHFTLALIGVSAVRDADSVIENKMLELKAETARQDIVSTRKAAAIGNPVVLLASKARGLCDSLRLANQLVRAKNNFATDYLKQIDHVAEREYGHIDSKWPEYVGSNGSPKAQ